MDKAADPLNYKFMKQQLTSAQQSLEEKLDSISEGGEISLTKTEAAIYGTSHSDSLPGEEIGKEAEDDH